ncbi:MAG TPA: transglycosylase SLT domain-containing protein [Polyangiales bacterium]|nr:transglycosylase SLT domain-containing protein [Polyangiales bacterium]
MRLFAALVLTYVVGLNCTVRRFGGDANPLSLLRLPEKTQAVLMLGAHAVKHVWNDHCDEPSHYVVEAARERGIPVAFAMSIARVESNFKPHSISSTGAMGLMQLMPQTAREHGVMDPFDPEDNARGAMSFIDTLWKRYRGDRLRIAAAYNAGPARVAQRGKLSVPAETRSYAKRVVARAKGDPLSPLPVAAIEPAKPVKKRGPIAMGARVSGDM